MESLQWLKIATGWIKNKLALTFYQYIASKISPPRRISGSSPQRLVIRTALSRVAYNSTGGELVGNCSRLTQDRKGTNPWQ